MYFYINSIILCTDSNCLWCGCRHQRGDCLLRQAGFRSL